MTVHGLTKMKVMVIIACDEYGALTQNGYCSYFELLFAYENKIPIIVVQMGTKNWPPIPSTNDRDGAGAAQNRFVLGRQGLCKLRWHQQEWDVAKCAKEIKDAFNNLQRDTLPSTQGIPQVPTKTNTSPHLCTLETEYKSSRALGKVDANLIDVCIILLHSPSMLHRLSRASDLIHDIEKELQRLSKLSDVSILLVDGSDEDNMNLFLKKDLDHITSLVFAGEGIEYDSCMIEEWTSPRQSVIIDLVTKLKEGDKTCRPQVSIAFKYGANAFKADLKSQGIEAEVWDLKTSESSSEVVNVWKKNGSLFRSLQVHLTSVEKKENRGYSSVETLAWSPPTLKWQEQFYGNLTLNLGDSEQIEEMRDVLVGEIESEGTKFIKVQPCQDSNDDDLYLRARSMTYFVCQESSRKVKNTVHSPLGWYYVSEERHLKEVDHDITRGQSGCIVIWIDCNDVSTLNLQKWYEGGNITGQVQVVYVITGSPRTENADNDNLFEEFISGPIKDKHRLSKTEDFKTITIDPPRTDIVLSQRLVSVDVTLRGIVVRDSTTSSVPASNEWQNIMMEEFFDSTNTGKNKAADISSPLEQYEAFFHKGDDSSVHFRVGIRHIKQLKHMFSLIFFPDSRKALESKLRRLGIFTEFGFMMNNPLKIFHQCVLELDTPTKDQRRALKKMNKKKNGSTVINGRAGSGKTYLVVHYILKRLTRKNDNTYMLLCLDAKPLGNDIVKWLCTRLGGSISDLNKKLKRIHFFYRNGNNTELYQIQIDDSDEEEPELCQDPLDDSGAEHKYDLIVVDEGHHVFRKGADEFKENIKRLLKENKQAHAMILFDSSQAPSINTDLPKEFQEKRNIITLAEVVRSSPVLTEASKVFQRYNQDTTTNHLRKQKMQGFRPGAIIFNSKNGKDNVETCANEAIAELRKIMNFFPEEIFHDKAAIIVSDDDARTRLLEEGGLEDELDELGFRAVTAMEASERFSNDPPKDDNWYIIVDTISNINGMERLFVIVVDMDKPLEESEEKNQKNLSEIYCACTRGMLYVSFVNKYITNGWMSFFNFTESETPPPPSSPMDKIEDDKEFATSNDDLRPSNALSKNEAKGAKPDDIPVGVANDACQGRFDATSSYKPTSYQAAAYGGVTKYDVQVMSRTKIFDISKSKLDSTENIPTFYPFKATIGMSEFDPYIYKGGRAPKVPFIQISPDVGEIEERAFEYNDCIERLVIPNTVTGMGACALSTCSKLKNVIYQEGSSLLHIGGNVFSLCPMIEEMNFPPSLETLGDNAFLKCEGLKKVTLSPKMTTIEGLTFNGCTSLTTVEGMSGIRSIEMFAFVRCSSLESIDINQNADIHDNAFKRCNAVINYVDGPSTTTQLHPSIP